MSRFFSIPGMSPYAGGKKRSTGNQAQDMIAALRDEGARRRHPLADEFYANRPATSHQHSGFKVEDDSTKGNILFRGEPARVVNEEFDQHTGKLTTTVARSQRGSSGTTEITWSPVSERRIEISDTKTTTN